VSHHQPLPTAALVAILTCVGVLLPAGAFLLVSAALVNAEDRPTPTVLPPPGGELPPDDQVGRQSRSTDWKDASL